MLFSLAMWYTSQKIMCQNIIDDMDNLPISTDIKQLIMEFIYCDKCKTLINDDCCCWILVKAKEEFHILEKLE